MNINTNYQMQSSAFRARLNNQLLQTNPSFGNKQKMAAEGGKVIATTLATATAGIILAAQNGKAKTEVREKETSYGQVKYKPKGEGVKSSLVVTRLNGTSKDLFEGIPQEVLDSPVINHVHQANSSTINPKVGIILVQNKSDKTVMARKIPIEGTLAENMVKCNMNEIPVKHDINKDSQYINAPWSDQYITQKSFMVIYGTVDKGSWALDSYLDEYANPETGKAPDVAILAAERGAEDRSFVPANIALGQYDLVLENGERIPCDYEKMEVGKVYNIAKKEAILKMAVPSEDVISSEGENLKAGKLYMVDSMGHFYNGQPIKRIKSGEVSWEADMNNPVQANIRNLIDESLRLEAEANAIKKDSEQLIAKAKEANSDAIADELRTKADELTAKANEITAQAKSVTANAEQAMTEWVKSAQNPEGVDFFAE